MSKNGSNSLKNLDFFKTSMSLIFQSPKVTVSRKNKFHLNNLKPSGCFENFTKIIQGKNQVSRKGLYRKISQKQISSFVYNPKKTLYAKIQACKSTNVAYSLLQNLLRIVKKKRRITLVLPLYRTIIYAYKNHFSLV